MAEAKPFEWPAEVRTHSDRVVLLTQYLSMAQGDVLSSAWPGSRRSFAIKAAERCKEIAMMAESLAKLARD